MGGGIRKMKYSKAKIELTNRSGQTYTVDTNGVVVNETTGHIMKGRIKNGYHLICINQKYIPIHRLVATAFCENPENKPHVNHINGIKSDNHASNLEWCTHRENMQHAVEIGLWQKTVGVEHGMCKNTEEDVRTVCELLEKGFNWKHIKNKVNMSRNAYLGIRRRANWKHISCEYKF
jgi:hypothetical protein